MKRSSLLFLSCFACITGILAQNPFAGGDGSATNPYKIGTVVQLDSVRNHLSSYYYLENDLDLNVLPYNSGSGWKPIGTESIPFTGNFNGANHMIRGLFINDADPYVGLFGYISGSTIDSLGLLNCSVSGGLYDIGCLVGFSLNGNITACFASGYVSGLGDAGGLVGFNQGTITASYFTGSVSNTNASGSIGGLVGYGNNGIISNCYSTSDVTGINCTAGGLAGAIASNSTIQNSYSAGSVYGGNNQGGIVGVKYYSNVTSSFYNYETSGQSDTDKGIPLTTDQMRDSTFLLNYINYNSDWGIRDGRTYAALCGVSNNAPFAFPDNILTVSKKINLDTLLLNDFDFETRQTKLILKVDTIYGDGTVSNGKFNLNSDVDSLRYRIGELMTTDTLWGNSVKATFSIKYLYPVAQINSNTSFTISWNKQPDATGYTLEVASDNAFASFVNGYDGSIVGTDTSYILTNLDKNCTYYYKVTAFQGNDTILTSKIIAITIPYGNNTLAFDGIDDYISLPALQDTIDFSNGFAFTGWIRLTAFSYYARLFDFGNGAGSDNILLTLEGGTNILKFHVVNGSENYEISTGNVLEINEWTHVAVSVYPSGIATIFINGEPAVTNSGVVYTIPSVERRDCYLGKSNWSSDGYFSGYMDEISFWNKGLDSAAVDLAMFQGLCGTEDSLLAYYKFNQGGSGADNSTVNVLTDSSYRKMDGSLINFALNGDLSNWINPPFQAIEATDQTSTSFVANWTYYPANTVYKLEVATDGDFINHVPGWEGKDINNNTSITVDNLDINTNYYYRVVACTKNDSVTSNMVSVTTLYDGNNSLAFDGVDDYIELPALLDTIDFSNGFTYMGWIKWNALHFYSRLFDFGNGASLDNILLTIENTTNVLKFHVINGTTNYEVYTGNIIDTEKWMHVAVTVDAKGETKIYINGKVTETSGGEATVIPSVMRGDCYLGRSNWSTDGYFNGNMDEVSFWYKGLDSVSVANAMHYGLSGAEDSLIVYYKFNQGMPCEDNSMVTELYDVTSNMIDGTLNSFALSGCSSNWEESFIRITSSAPINIVAGMEYNYEIRVTNVDDALLTYVLSGQPDGMVINNNIITWTPAEGVVTSGEVILTVRDRGLTDSQIFTVAVNKVYAITATADENGGISPSGNVIVNEGEDQTFIITANSGYQIYDVMVDGISVGAVNSYTFTGMAENHSITASFAIETNIDNPLAKEVYVFPNPAYNELHVKNAVNCTLRISTLTGSVLSVITLKSSDEEIDISSLPAGIYLVTLDNLQMKLVKCNK